MTPADIELAARRRYNSVSDSFWSQQEIFDMIYAACLEIADENYAVERTYSTTTVSGTQGYDYPENAIAIKRATYNGRKLTKVDMIEDDVLTGLSQNTTATGTPEFYWTWNNTIYLRPVPNDALTLELWSFNQPSPISSATATLEIPTQHHMRLINYVLSGMAAKDSNYQAAQYYLQLWQKDKAEIRKSIATSKRRDKFTTVKDEQMVVETYIGGQ